MTVGGSQFLHLYIENSRLDPGRFRVDFHEALIETHEEYASYNAIMATNPISVTILAPGTYDKYLLARQAEGADLGHLKPPRMQPSDEIIAKLLEIGVDRGPRTR